MNKSKNKLIKTFILLVVVSGISAFVFLENQTKEQEIYKIRKEITDSGKLPDEEELTNKKTELLKKENLLSVYLFDKNNPIEFIEVIESLGAQNLLDTNVDKVDVAEEDIVMDVSVKGTLENIKAFVLSLENINKEINIKSVRFNKVSTEKEVYWNATLNVIGKTK